MHDCFCGFSCFYIDPFYRPHIQLVLAWNENERERKKERGTKGPKVLLCTLDSSGPRAFNRSDTLLA